MNGGFHIWRLQNVRFLTSSPPCLPIHATSLTKVAYYVCFWRYPLPPQCGRHKWKPLSLSYHLQISSATLLESPSLQTRHHGSGTQWRMLTLTLTACSRSSTKSKMTPRFLHTFEQSQNSNSRSCNHRREMLLGSCPGLLSLSDESNISAHCWMY